MNRTAHTIGLMGAIALACWMAAAAYAQSSSDGATSSSGSEIKRLRGHSAKVSSLAFSRDGRYAVSGGGVQTDFFGMGRAVWMDCTARLWELSTGKEIRKFEGHAEAITGVQVSSDNSTLLTASSDNTVRIWNIQTGRMIHLFKGNLGELSADGKTVAVALKEGAIEVYEIGTGHCRARMVGHHNGATSLAYSADGQLLLSGGNDETARIWNAKSAKAVRSIRLGDGQIPLRVAFDSNARRIVIVTDSMLSLWDSESGQQVSMAKVTSADQKLSWAAFSDDRRQVFCREPGKPTSVYDLASSAPVGVLPAETSPVIRVAISPDAKSILLGLDKSNDLVLRPLVIVPAAKSE